MREKTTAAVLEDNKSEVASTEKPKRKKSESVSKNSKKISYDSNSHTPATEDTYIVTEKGVQLQVAGLASISKVINETVVSVQRNELRFLVDTYYQTQDMRISTDNQIRSIVQGYDGEGADIPMALQWIAANAINQEKQIQKMLDSYTNSDSVGQWAKSICGIGPTIAASLIAYFDITKANYAGNFWSYAGLNDNNNPWLGVDKSKALVKEALAVIKEKRETSIMIFTDSVIESAKGALKLVPLGSFYGPTGAVSVAKSILNDDFDDIKNLLKAGFEVPEFSKFIRRTNLLEMAYVLEYLAQPADYATEELFEYVASETGRDVNKIKELCRVDEEKNYVTKLSLEKYLAKPPYNTSLKTLCWKIGESFVKCSNKPNSLYGRLYKERRDYETKLNEKLTYSDQAENILKTKNIGKATDAYKWYSKGMLPPAHIMERSKRYAVKLFISHLFECMYANYKGVEAPSPYVIDYLGHVQYIGPEVPYSNFIVYKDK